MASGRATILSGMAGLALAAAPAQAQPADASFIRSGMLVEAPRGFVEMCRTGASFCAGTPQDAGADLVTGAVTLVASTPRVGGMGQPVDLLRRVNLLVNRRVRQVTDAQQFGREEVWRRPGLGRGAAGDCEDIAIEKRHLLVEAGFDPHALRFAVVYTPRIGAHVVLVARTPGGDVVLDSLTPLLHRWDATNYLWVSIQSADQPTRWTTVERSPKIIAAVHGPIPG